MRIIINVITSPTQQARTPITLLQDLVFCVAPVEAGARSDVVG